MEPKDEQERKTTEIRLDIDEESSTSDDWASLLKEMERTPARKKAAKPVETPPEQAPKKEPPRPEPTSPRAYFIQALDELEAARDALREFVANHPYLVAPNIHKMWDECIKECEITMQRQIERMDQTRTSTEGNNP